MNTQHFLKPNIGGRARKGRSRRRGERGEKNKKGREWEVGGGRRRERKWRPEKMKSHLEGGGFIGVVKEDMADET